MNYHRVVLLAAVAIEVTGTSALKVAADEYPVAGHVVALALLSTSLVLLSVALRKIPVAAAYALWEGLGIMCLAVIGHVAFGEAIGVMRVLGLAAILAGICLLLRGTRARPA